MGGGRQFFARDTWGGGGGSRGGGISCSLGTRLRRRCRCRPHLVARLARRGMAEAHCADGGALGRMCARMCGRAGVRGHSEAGRSGARRGGNHDDGGGVAEALVDAQAARRGGVLSAMLRAVSALAGGRLRISGTCLRNGGRPCSLPAPPGGRVSSGRGRAARRSGRGGASRRCRMRKQAGLHLRFGSPRPESRHLTNCCVCVRMDKRKIDIPHLRVNKSYGNALSSCFGWQHLL